MLGEAAAISPPTARCRIKRSRPRPTGSRRRASHASAREKHVRTMRRRLDESRRRDRAHRPIADARVSGEHGAPRRRRSPGRTVARTPGRQHGSTRRAAHYVRKDRDADRRPVSRSHAAISFCRPPRCEVQSILSAKDYLLHGAHGSACHRALHRRRLWRLRLARASVSPTNLCEFWRMPPAALPQILPAELAWPARLTAAARRFSVCAGGHSGEQRRGGLGIVPPTRWRDSTSASHRSVSVRAQSSRRERRNCASIPRPATC